MEPIADQAALRPVLESLKAKGLLVDFTPEGRGQVVGHALFAPREMESLLGRYRSRAAEPRSELPPIRGVSTAASPEPPAERDHLDRFFREIEDIREQMAQLRQEFDEVRAVHARTSEELDALKKSLGE